MANYLIKSRWKKWSALFLLTVIGGSLTGEQNLIAISQPTKPPVLLGLYTSGYAGDRRVINNELRQVDEWAGKRHSVVGIPTDSRVDVVAFSSYNWGYKAAVINSAFGYVSPTDLDQTEFGR